MKETLKNEVNIYREYYKDFEYWIIRPKVMTPIRKSKSLHLCGYVVIPKDSEYYISDNCDDFDIECHGCLTYSGGLDYLSIPFCIGFDCNHPCDISELKPEHFLNSNAKYRDVAFVRSECKSIINQLINKFKVKPRKN